MKFSENWLREWVDPAISTEELVTQLTSLGLEVDDYSRTEPLSDKVLVGEITSVEPHPDAERLQICRVDIGGDTDLNIVCGAPNVYVGMRAPLAMVGAKLVGGVKIRRSKIRGVESQGMLCSPIELGLGDDAGGILDLGAAAETGRPADQYLAAKDAIIHIDLTPNRGDCLGISGIAREVSVRSRCSLTPVSTRPVPAVLDDVFAVELRAPAHCPRYVGRVIRDIDPNAPTPLWMCEKLRRCGLRSISPVVDVTNFVMLELGQPMHAFDLEKLEGAIHVRLAEDGEYLTLLDGNQLALDSTSLVIADDQHSVALAGIMGGLDTSVTSGTRHVFLESAHFNPKTIALEARRQGLHTDSSHRFERSVRSDGQAHAVERATALLLDIVGGRPGPTMDTNSVEHLPEQPEIRLRAARISRVLGMDVPAGDVTDALERIGMQVSANPGEWQVVPPTFRPDISMETDLIEEIARVIGYENIPVSAPRGAFTMRPLPESSVGLAKFRDALVARDYQEAVTYSFVDRRLQALMDPEIEPVALANPISADLAVMRTSLLPGLVQAVSYNINRQQSRVRLFESGLVFRPEAGGLRQEPTLAGAVFGPADPVQWGRAGEPADFFDLKSDVEALLALLGPAAGFRCSATSHPALHPGQAAAIAREGTTVGFLGGLHPRIVRDLKLPGPVWLFELQVQALGGGKVPRYRALSKFPATRRDIAVVLAESTSFEAIRNCVGQAGIDVLINLELFDVYRGEGIDSGKKSVALGLTFQADSRTLNDREIDLSVDTIIDSLTTHLGGTLRG